MSRPVLRPVLGAALIAVMVAAVVLVYKTFSGDFGDNLDVRASVAQVGDSLETGDVVVYRDVIVGEVTSFEPDGVGGASIALRLKADLARQVPQQVTALALPANLFGATQVVLIPPKTLDGEHLHGGQQVPADRSPSAAGLQTALADAYKLITAVRPAQLNAALTAISTALSGQGGTLNALLRRTDHALAGIEPSLPALNRTVRSLATVSRQFAAQAPNLLDAAQKLLAPARAIVRQRAAITRLFGVVPGAAQDFIRFLRATSDDVVTVVTNARPILDALTADPDLAGRLVGGLKKVTDAVNAASVGGRLHVQVAVGGVNIPGIFQTQVGRPSEVLRSSSDVPLYTADDCPRYPGAQGANCRNAGGQTSAAARSDRSTAAAFTALSTAGQAGVPGSARGGAAENAAAKAFLAGLSGRPASEVPDGMGAFVTPLLRGRVTVLR